MTKRKSAEIEKILEFQLATLTQAVGVLLKGMAFYLAIAAAVLGYAIGVDIEIQFKKILLQACLLVTGIFFLVAISIAYGVIFGVLDMKRTSNKLHKKAFKELHMDKYFRRGIFVGVVSVTGAAMVLGILAITILKIYLFIAEPAPL